MIPTEMQRARAQELLADRATQGLDAAGEAELRGILGPRWSAAKDEVDGFEIAAAGVHLAAIRGRVEEMPAHLMRAVEQRALGMVAAAPVPPSTNEASARVIELGSRREARPARSAMIVALPWMAAAACVAFAVTAWLARPRPQTTLARPFEYRAPVVMPSAAPNPNAPDGLDPAAARAELLRTATDVVQVAWSAGKDSRDAHASGDVVWSAKEQRGYMRFEGVASNDPKTLQYQLWIFDAERDDRFPVDGGVFDVGSGEVVVPIRGKLDVGKAKLFAVTAEKPGGVVVSKRERLVVTAAVKTG